MSLSIIQQSDIDIKMTCIIIKSGHQNMKFYLNCRRYVFLGDNIDILGKPNL